MTRPPTTWQAATVALFPRCHATTPSAHVPISDVLLQIRCPAPEVQELIDRIRAATTKDERSRLKQLLPAATFSVDLHHRQHGTPLENRLIAWSRVLQIDLDNLANPAAVRASLEGDPFVAAIFLSPSGTGLKVLVLIADPQRFADCWRAADAYFRTCHGLTVDPAPKHPTSLCYLSADPDVFVAAGEVLEFHPLASDSDARKPAEPYAANPDPNAPKRPGDEFNERGDIPALLIHHGWTLHRDGSNQLWRRPGKAEDSSATFNGRVFYVFSSNAAPFEPHHGYSRFAVYALLEHGGDFAAAAADLRRHGFGDAAGEGPEVDLSGLVPPPASSALLFDLQPFSETPERQVDWLWPNVIPRGMLSLIGGKQGLGKSFLICDLAARVSSGQPMPDGTPRPPGKVLLLAREDDASCVLLPRLRAAGADLGRVFWSIFANAVTGSPIDLASHVAMLAEAVTTHHFDLIVVDTFAAFAPADTDANAAQDVRCLLDALTRLARSTGAAVVVVAHLRKTGQGHGDPMDAIAGSAQMTAGVRVASLLDKGMREGERWFRVVKSNLGRIDEQGWTWRFHWPDPFTEGVSDMPCLVWSTAGAEYEGHEPGKPAETPDSEVIRSTVLDVLAQGPRSQASACDLVCAKLRSEQPRPTKTDIEVVLAELIAAEALEAWDGPRGAKMVGLPGSQPESSFDKALRIARERPSISVNELRDRAGCRKETACEALRLSKKSTPQETA